MQGFFLILALFSFFDHCLLDPFQAFQAHADQQKFEKIELDGLEFEYRYREDLLDIQVRCRTTGWVGVGFDPTYMMQGANLIMGYVDQEGVHLSDRFGVDLGEHAADEDLGGQNNLQSISGFEKKGWTELHFSIPINSEDPFDRPLYRGEPHTLLLACGGDGKDNFVSKHRRVMMQPWNPE